MENLPIQKRERSKMASKWIIETPSPRERELPAPVGFSREGNRDKMGHLVLFLIKDKLEPVFNIN